MDQPSPPSVTFRAAREEDLAAIVALLADDDLGSVREAAAGDAVADCYRTAFAAVAADPNHAIIVGEADGAILACLQLSILPTLVRRGGWRAQIEGVRVASAARGRGLGTALLRHAIAEARRRGCVLVQLTSDKRRPDAIRLYLELGFLASHEGLKLSLE